MRKVLHVHRHRLVLLRLEPAIEAQVADDEIDLAIAREIPSDDAVPPAVALLDAGNGHLHQPAVACIVKHRDRHPLADDDEIRPAVAVDVLPDRVSHHPDP